MNEFHLSNAALFWKENVNTTRSVSNLLPTGLYHSLHVFVGFFKLFSLCEHGELHFVHFFHSGSLKYFMSTKIFDFPQLLLLICFVFLSKKGRRCDSVFGCSAIMIDHLPF